LFVCVEANPVDFGVALTGQPQNAFGFLTNSLKLGGMHVSK
jgi:hypothetical protein